MKMVNESRIKEKEIITSLQDAWDENNKEKFLSIIYYLENTRIITSKEAKILKTVYDDWEEYKSENPNAKISFAGDIKVRMDIKENKSMKNRRLKEFFDYTGAIPIEELMDILTEEWQDYNKSGLFRESSYYEDEARDENKFIEISAITSFETPLSTGYGFSSKRVQKFYDDAIDYLYSVAKDDEEFDELIQDYEPILFIIQIDLKDLIIYADVDLGGLASTEVARERLADNESDFRKQIQRMIQAF